MSNIPFLTSKEVVSTNNIVPILNKTFAKMAAKKAGTTLVGEQASPGALPPAVGAAASSEAAFQQRKLLQEPARSKAAALVEEQLRQSRASERQSPVVTRTQL